WRRDSTLAHAERACRPLSLLRLQQKAADQASVLTSTLIGAPRWDWPSDARRSARSSNVAPRGSGKESELSSNSAITRCCGAWMLRTYCMAFPPWFRAPVEPERQLSATDQRPIILRSV